MRFALPPLELLPGFEAAARTLSFTLAAQDMFVTQSAMSRQIKALEDHVGAPLFVRKHRALELTDEGRLLLDATKESLERLREAMRSLRSEPDPRQVNVTTTPGFASLWLIPRLQRFTDAQPGVDVRISATNDVVDLVRDRVDVAIRYCAPAGAAGTLLFGERNFPVCAPSLLADPARPLAVPRDLARHVLLTMDYGAQRDFSLDWGPWLRAMGLPGLRPARTLRFSRYDDVIAAALGGQGVAIGRVPLLDDAIGAGRLVAPFAHVNTSERAYYIIEARNSGASETVRAFVDFLHAEAHRPPQDKPEEK